MARRSGRRPPTRRPAVVETAGRKLVDPRTLVAGTHALVNLRRALAGALDAGSRSVALVRRSNAEMPSRCALSVPLRQSLTIGRYLLKQRLHRNDKFPLLVELEPLYQCNLACSFCGKIQHPEHILKKRMPVETALAAIEESGAPMVSIAGGEPLVHPEVHVMARELIKRKKFVYLCTNGILMKKKMDHFEPSPYFAWVVHLDGMRERHDQFVEREGTFDKAVDAIREAQRRGFRVNTNTTFLTTDTPKTVRDVLDFLNDELEVDQMMISPAYAYEKAPDQEHFPGVTQARKLFSEAFADGRRKHWRLNHTPLFLDFLEGKVDFQCTPWGSRRTRSSAGSGPAT